MGDPKVKGEGWGPCGSSDGYLAKPKFVTVEQRQTKDRCAEKVAGEVVVAVKQEKQSAESAKYCEYLDA